MSKVTQTAIVESKQAIWDYNPQDPSNRVDGGLDVIAAIRTLAVKVCPRIPSFHCHVHI